MKRQHIITYAQNREDIILSGFFDEDEKGFYVDIGANDPIHESVTKYFYDKGWSGINVEPIPVMHKKLVEARPRDINVAIGIGSKAGKAQLHYYPNGDGLSTLSEKMAKDYAKEGSAYTNEEVITEIEIITLSSLFEKNIDQPIHFMKVDVEGYEYEVLAGNDWNKFRPQVICIEANHVKKDWHPLLKKQGYSLSFYDGLNEYYTDDSTDRAKKFDYVRAIIFNEPIVNFRLLEDFKEYEDEVASLKSEATLLSKQLQDSRNLIEELTPLKRHIKRQVKARLNHLRSRTDNQRPKKRKAN